MISAIQKQPDGSVELTVTIPQKQVQSAYQKALAEFTRQAEIKGFRKGKAPAKLVEEKIGKTKIYEEVLQSLVPEAYLEAIKEHHITPVMNPKIQVVSLEENKDWQFKATTAELPPISLDGYKDAIRKVLAADKIWVPGKDAKDTKTEPSDEAKMAKVFTALLQNVKLDLPKAMIEEEVDRMMARLVDQINQLGLTVDKYLAAQGKTAVQLRSEYEKQAAETLKLELILARIAEEDKVQVKEDEIDRMIKAVPDEKTRQSLESPQERAYLRQILKKRAVVDSLLKL